MINTLLKGAIASALFAGAASAALVAVEASSQIETCIRQAEAAIVANKLDLAAGPMSDFWDFASDSYLAQVRPYVVVDGILEIPVKGVLLNDFPYALGNWATGYDYIWQAFARGMGDPDVKGIALVCNTPGGMVAGNFDLVDRMYDLKQQVGKPVRGYASEMAYSAGYSIISISDVITVSRTGGVGSVGVVTGHMDESGALEKMGLKYTFIYAGKHKIDGNPTQALSKDAESRMQARIDALYQVFVSTVARNRPTLSEQDIRDSEALCFTAAEAVTNRFADKIGALDDALADFSADLTPCNDEDETMTTKEGAVDQAVHEAAVATARSEGHAAGRAEGHGIGLKEGATAERSRIAAILASEEGKDRPAAAMSTAMKTAMSLDDAKAFLADLPKEAASADASTKIEAPKDPLTAAMELTGGGAGVGADGKPSAAANSIEATMSVVHAMGLPGFKPAA